MITAISYLLPKLEAMFAFGIGSRNIPDEHIGVTKRWKNLKALMTFLGMTKEVVLIWSEPVI